MESEIGYEWVATAGGSGRDEGSMSVVDELGNVTVAGTYSGTVDFDPGVGVETLSAVGGRDIYVAKYTGGGALLWVKSLGGAGAEEVRGLAQDGAGQLYLVGSFSG